MKNNQNPMNFQITEATVGTRLDLFAAAEAGISRSAAVKLIENGDITVNQKVSSKNYKLRENDTVSVLIPEPESDEAQAEDIPLDVVYEDSDIIIINKPVGMVVHPAAGHREGTLVNALIHHCGDSLSGIGGVMRPGIVHRIDKDTSGLIAVAKNDASHNALSAQLKDHSMRRVYTALAVGNLKEDTMTVDEPIGRSIKDRKKMAVVRDGERTSRRAVTHITVEERYTGACLIKCELETGRTHQIRVHLSFLGHPLLGDTVYGGGHTRFEKENAALICGQCLHAHRLTLKHPKTGELMSFDAPIPEYFERLISKLRKSN